MARAPFALVFFLSFVFLSLAGCSSGGGHQECGTNADCSAGRMCAPNGSCVQCLSNDQCGEGQFCCRGGCYDEEEVEDRCGCQPSPTGRAGQSCEGATNVCLVEGERATAEDVASGTCGCSCDATAGGTLCTLDEDGAVACGCDRSDPQGTCERPALDASGNPHIVADTCSPQETCVCFAEGAACDPRGATPDCTAAGCVNALNDVENCGIGGRVCTDPDMGIEETGTCVNGGCTCDAQSDCQGPNLNVNQCVLVGSGVPQCVCDDYEVEENVKGACPLGLPCVVGGCELDGVAYGTRTELLQALGVFP